MKKIKFKRSLLALILTTVLAVSFVGCGSKTESKNSVSSNKSENSKETKGETGDVPSDDDTVVIAITGFNTEDLSPISTDFFTKDNVVHPLFDSLLDIDEDRNIVPEIAESYEVNKDYTQITFVIRDGVKFHDGSDVTAEDVKYSIERYAKDDCAWGSSLRVLFDKVEIEGDNKVTVSFKSSEPQIVQYFTAHYNTLGVVLPKDYIEKVGEEEFRKHPIGTGPYKFLESESGSSITFEAVEDHWRLVPEFKFLKILEVADGSTRLSMLRGGQVDLIQASFDDLDSLESDSNIHLLDIKGERMSGIYFQGTWKDTGEATQNVKVREAIDYAINRQEIADEFFSGYAKPEKYWKVSDAGENWDPSWKATEYNPEKAKELLKEAGYPDAFEKPTIRFYTQPERAYQIKLTELVASYLQAVGLQVEIIQHDTATLENLLLVQDLTDEAYGAMGLQTSPVLTSDGILSRSQYNFYATDGSETLNHTDKEIDEWYKKGRASLDVNERNEYDNKILHRINDENKLFLGLNYIDTIWAASSKVGDWDAYNKPGSFALTYSSITKADK